MLSQKELKESIEKLQKVPQTVAVQVFSAILENLNLYQKSIDSSAIEILEKPSKEVVAIKDLDKLNEYLLALSKMRLYIQTEVNQRDIYTTFEEGDYQKNLNRLRQLKKNLIRNAKSVKEEENILLSQDKELEKQKRMIDISKMYQKTLYSYNGIIEEMGNAMKRIISKREMELQSELSKPKAYN